MPGFEIINKKTTILERKNNSNWSIVKKYKYYYLLLIPAMLWLLIFCYLPMLGIVVAFQDFNVFTGIFHSQWVGLRWFKELFQSSEFLHVFRNTAVISVLMLIFTFPAPIILALLLNECRSIVFKKAIQTISYLPHFISWAIIAGLMVTLLSPSTGIVNQVLKSFGMEPVYFMAEPKYTRGLMVFSSLWKGIGWSSILYLAALTGIPPTLYESAVLDGANKWHQTIYITIPGIGNIIIMTLIMAISNLFCVGFDQAYNLVIPPTYETGRVISTYIYDIGITSFQYGFSTAMGLFQSIIGMILIVCANSVAKKFNEEAAIW